MTISAEMENLGKDIIASFEARKSGINALVKETAKMLNAFKKEQTAVARDIKKKAQTLNKSLKAGEEKRLQEFRAFLTELKERDKERQQEQNQMANRVREMLAEFDDEFEKVKAENRLMAEAWKKMSFKMAGKRRGKINAHIRMAA